MNRFQVAIMIVGGMVFIYGAREWQLKTVAKEQPRAITAAELASNGPGNNAHIILTGFNFCDEFIYEYKQQKGGQEGEWTKVWVLAIPTGQPLDRANVRIIVADSSCRTKMDIATMETRTLQGVIINKISSLGARERKLLHKLLQESYPGSNLSNCWIVERNRKPLAAGHVMLLMGGGGITTLFGVALIAQAARS